MRAAPVTAGPRGRSGWPTRALPVLLVCALLSGCWGTEQDTHPNQVLTKRRAVFKQYTRILEPIGLVANGRKEFKRDEFLANVQDLEKLADKPWAYFTEDGNYPPTHALPEVWSQPEKFHQAQQNFEAAVHQLALTAQHGSQAEISTAVDAVTQSCKSCHHDFRSN